VDRAIDVLELLRDADGPLGVRDVARRLGISSATSHRLLTSLRLRGLVTQVDGSRAYTLGWALLDFAAAVLRRIDLPTVAAPIARQLRDVSGETVTIQVPVGNDRVCVFELEGTHEVRRRVGLGRRVPLHAGASGRAILAFMTASDIEQVLDAVGTQALTDRTVVERSTIEATLEQTRDEGVARGLGETVDEVASVAAPVFAPGGTVVGSIAISGPSGRWTQASIRQHTPALLAGAAEISRRLGYAGGPDAVPTAAGGRR